ncbi:flagellar hook-length control protein FliK [Lederbergia citri]|uniref:Flagellar hook-length control protein FliK n=1 Tax=Lederbergia citri TaxID=2833580 RepID=A0A942YH11_9BACI|nr:flagellar hook-length control protein FliK [Lederbergia citri]MBS4193986.1 flagellar hook-length control protein FliK [Lederbergia citri]
MKIGGLESTFFQEPLSATSSMTTNNSRFQMILGATLANNGKILTEEQSAQEMDIITSLIEALMENVDTDEMNFNQDLRQSLDETIQKLVDWLKENVDSVQLPESIKQDELLPEDFLSASVLLFNIMNEVNNDTLKSLPLEKTAPYIKAVKEFLFVAKENVVSLKEMQQLEELEVSMEHLLKRLQEMAKDTKHQNMRHTLDNVFSKGKELNHFQQLGNSSNVLQSLLGKTPHDRGLSKQIVDANLDMSTNSNPVLRTESFILNVRDSVNEETAMRGFVREFSNILARSSLTKGFNTTRLLIRLHPEELGTLRVELLQKDGQMTARILASTHKAKEMLDLQLSSLRQAFTQQNISVDRLEVTYSQTDLQRYTNQEGRGNQQHQQEQNQEQRESSQEHDSNFKDALSNILFETEV